MNRRFAYIMACCLVFSQLPVRSFAATTSTTEENTQQKGSTPRGDLEVTVNLDYPVYNLEEMGLEAVLLDQSGKEIDSVKLTSVTRTEGDKCYAIFENLPIGTYKVKLRGENYKTYISGEIELVKNEKHLIINTGNDTFTIGDINADGKIDDIDLSLMEEALQKEDETYDLNGDKLVDIEDLAQLFWSKSTEGSVNIVTGKRIFTEDLIKTDDIQDALGEENPEINITVQGEITSLFTQNSSNSEEAQPVVFKSDKPIKEKPIRIPLIFTEEVETSEIRFEAPADSAPTAGYVEYKDKNGVTQTVEFSSVETLETRAGRNATKVVKISLGKQVPLQKLTIAVTSSEGGVLAAISKIEFLQDVVDNSINQEQGIIKGFSGKALNEGVSLSWNKTSNVTGYKVSYGTEPGVYTDASYTNTNQIEINGLENFKPYYFVVQATNGDWEGPISGEITVTPEPVDLPSSPREVKTSIFDKAVKISFRTGDDSTGANIYYKKVTDATYTKVENVKSNTFVRDLENNVEYMFYVTSVNSAGESKPSEIVKATPIEDTIIEPAMPTLGRIDNSHIKNITMLDNSNVDTKYYPNGFSPESLIDGDFTTHWTAQTYQKARGVRVTFDKPYEMDYVAMVPRLDRDLDRHNGTRKYFEYISYYSIKIWETLDSEPITLLGKTEIPVRQSDGLRLLPFDKRNVEQIEIGVFEWDGAGNASISELAFYEYNDIVDQIDEVFEDDLHTKLKPNITIEDIEALEQQLDMAIAQGAVLWVSEDILRAEIQAAKEILATNTITNLGEIVEVVQTRQRSTAQNQNFAADGLSDLQATGTMAYAEDKILVYVEAPEGGNIPELVVSQFYGDETWNKSIQLKPGRNIVDIPRVVTYNGEKGGSLYLRYNGEEQDTTTVRIVNAISIPTLELTSLEDSVAVKDEIREYINELSSYVEKLPTANKEKNPANSTEIGTDKILLSLPAEEIYRGITDGISGDVDAQVERLYESLMTWDENIKLHYSILGLEENASEAIHRYPKSRFNIRYMPMNNGVFMYAGGDHIGIQYGSGAALVKGDRSAETGYFGWGINHEIGHIINDENFVLAEVTNNIFSLFAQTVNGGPSRLEENYDKIYNKVVSKDTGLSSNVFVNLGMFWQLHLAYDDTNQGVNEDGFYPTLHKLSRESSFNGLDNMNTFIRLASDTVQKDLTPFFERWGLHISQDTYDYTSKYQKETSAIYYLNDDAMRYRLENGAPMSEGSTVSVHAEVGQSDNTSDKVVNLTLSSDISSDTLLGYEIYRDNELIAFTTEDTYVDDISANNVTHTYSVVAYDKLLNKTDKFQSNEVYIATEGIISKSTYTTQRTTSAALQIEFNGTPEVVGLKFKDVSTSNGGNYTVEISQDGENWTVAKESKLKDGTNLIYFNKPGTTDEDDRIWTYDAKYIKITSKEIENISDEQIDVLEYPGDAVYFTEGAIGRLDSDYVFDGGIIEKGTLVVMGSYRGHPVYSKIVLSAEYVAEKDYDESEKPGYDVSKNVTAVDGEMYMFAELPEDQQVSKVGNGIWLFVPKEQSLPSRIKANMFRTDDATSTEGGRLVSDTKWLIVPSEEDMPLIELN